jgi:hypothetical protein
MQATETAAAAAALQQPTAVPAQLVARQSQVEGVLQAAQALLECAQPRDHCRQQLVHLAAAPKRPVLPLVALAAQQS